MTILEFIPDHILIAARNIDTPSIKNIQDIFISKGLEFNNTPVIHYKDKVEGYYNFIITQKNVIFLPNWLSEIIQIYGKQNINTTTLKEIQVWTFEILNKFRILCEIRAGLWWWLMFNPYQQPFNTLRVITEWYLTGFTGVFPVILGIDMGPALALGLLGFALDWLNQLVFTMPYLPSEGEKFSVTNLDGLEMDNPALADLIRKIGEDVIVFRYLPYLWYKNPIPDNIREYWYTKKPEILRYFVENYGDLGIDFFPNRILQTEYEKQISQGIITINMTSLKEMSTNLLCSLNQGINSDKILNDFIHIFEKYLHN